MGDCVGAVRRRREAQRRETSDDVCENDAARERESAWGSLARGRGGRSGIASVEFADGGARRCCPRTSPRGY